MKGLKFFTLIILVLTALPLQAQQLNVESYRMNTVTIRTAYESGSGIICAKSADSIFVLSANHVVENSDGAIQISLADGGTFPGVVVFEDSRHDLVMLGARVDDFLWEPLPIATDVTLGERVFYITTLIPEKPLLPREGLATIDKWDYESGFQFASIRGVKPGDSGAAMLCQNGIAGIILTHQVKSLDILVARDLIRAWDKNKWQLTENP